MFNNNWHIARIDLDEYLKFEKKIHLSEIRTIMNALLEINRRLWQLENPGKDRTREEDGCEES